MYQGVFCLILREARDFHQNTPLSWERIQEDGADDHHIFPKAWLRGKVEARLVDCVLNRTLIDPTTNKRIRDKPPSKYVTEIRATNAALDGILASHAIPVGAESPEHDDDFLKFLDRRERLIAALIEKATGGKVVELALDEDQGAAGGGAFIPDEADDPDDVASPSSEGA